MKLTAEALRVLGCLVEKAATTPDAYPLSTAALVTACNQTSNRDPVVAYDERTIDAAMLELREAGLARTIRGAGHRVHKHRHVADEAYGATAREVAVLAVLMLRGAQTPGEINTRTQRYGADLDLASVEATLASLASREPAFVQRLERRPGERETRWVHLLEEPTEASTTGTGLAASVTDAPPAPPESVVSPPPPVAASAIEAPRAPRAPAEIEARVEALEQAVADLRAELGALVERLGG